MFGKGNELSIVGQIKQIADKSHERIEQVQFGEIIFVVHDGQVQRVQRKDGWREEDLS